MTEETKECQLCHQIFPKDSFYKRKDRNGEHTWTMSYCSSCDSHKAKLSRKKKPEYYKKYFKERSVIYYSENKDKYKIYSKKAYYKKLPLEKKEKYKLMLREKYPEIVNQICS